MSYDNTNRGTLFRNDRREKDTQPTHTGTLNVGGVDYYLSAWVKDGKNGKFFSLAVKPKNEAQPAKSQPVADFDDDIPF